MHEQVELAAAQVCDTIATNFTHLEWTGPRWHQIARALVLLSAAHCVDLPEVIRWVADNAELRSKLSAPTLPDWARAVLFQVSSSDNNHASDVKDWVTSKFLALFAGPAQKILSPPGCGMSIADVIDANTPMAISLSALGMSDGGMLGHIMLARVIDACMSRPANRRTTFRIYVDEAHRFPVGTLDRVLSEGRKFGVELVLATQHLLQFDRPLAEAASAASITVAFRQAPETADRLAARLGVGPTDLADQPDLHAYLKVAGYPTTALTVTPYERREAEAVSQEALF